MVKMTHVFEMEGVLLKPNDGNPQNRTPSQNEAMSRFLEAQESTNQNPSIDDPLFQEAIQHIHIRNEYLLAKVIHFLINQCGHSVRFVIPDADGSTSEYEHAMLVFAALYLRHEGLKAFVDSVQNTIVHDIEEPFIDAKDADEEKRKLETKNAYTWTSGSQVEEDASGYIPPVYLRNVLEDAYENLDEDQKANLEKDYEKLMYELETVGERHIVEPTKEKIDEFRIPKSNSQTSKIKKEKGKEKVKEAPVLPKSETSKPVHYIQAHEAGPSSAKVLPASPTIEPETKEIPKGSVTSTTEIMDAAQTTASIPAPLITPHASSPVLPIQPEGTATQSEETQEASPATVNPESTEGTPEEAKDVIPSKPSLRDLYRLWKASKNDPEAKLKQPQYSWFERNIKHPFIVYFAKRAFKQNRLDHFEKWTSRLPQKLNMIINPKTKETLHHYIAREIEKNHIAKKKEEKSGKKSTKKIKRLNQQLQKANQRANDGLQFFLELNYSAKYQHLHSAMTDEQFGQVIKSAQQDPEANKAAVSTEALALVEQSSPLQKAMLAFAMYARSPSTAEALLKNEGSASETLSPQSIVFGLFSKTVSKPSEFHELKSLENKNRLSPYQAFLKQVESRVQKNKSQVQAPSKLPQAELNANGQSENHTPQTPQAFQGWLSAEKPEINLTQQNQSESQSEQTQSVQTSSEQGQTTQLQTSKPLTQQEDHTYKSRSRIYVLVNKQHQVLEFYYGMHGVSAYFSIDVEKDRQDLHENFSAWMDRHDKQEQKRKVINEFFNQTPDATKGFNENYKPGSIGKDHAKAHHSNIDDILRGRERRLSTKLHYQKPEHLEQIEAWVQALVNETFNQNQIMITGGDELVLELDVDGSTVFEFDATQPTKLPPISAKLVPNREFASSPVLTFAVTENSAKNIDPDSIPFTNYEFLDAEVLEWLNHLEAQANEHRSAGFILLNRMNQARTSQPHLRLEIPNLEALKKEDHGFGGKIQLRYLLKKMLLERSQFGSDGAINTRLRLLMQLDQTYVVCPPFISATDQYSFLSLLNDYIFQNMWNPADWGGMASSDIYTRFLANPEFQALGEVLLNADASVLTVFFSILNYAHPLFRQYDGIIDSRSVQIVSLHGKLYGHTETFLNTLLPVFLNNYLHLKNLNLWHDVVALLQDDDLLNKIMQFGIEEKNTRTALTDAQLSPNNVQKANDTAVSREAYLYYLLFSHDITECSATQLKSLLNSIQEVKASTLQETQVEKESLFGKTRRLDLIRYDEHFEPHKRLSPYIHDLRYLSKTHEHRMYSSVPEFHWETVFSKHIQVILNQFMNMSNFTQWMCNNEQIHFFRNTLEKLFENNAQPSDEQRIILQGMVSLFLKYVENPLVKEAPLFWQALIEKYQPFLENNSTQGIELLKAEIESTDPKVLNTYVGEASVQIQQARKQLPEIGMRSFALLAIQGQLSEEDYEAAIELRNRLDLEHQAFEQTQQNNDARPLEERQNAFDKKLNELISAQSSEDKILLYRLRFAEDYEKFKIIRQQQNDKIKAREIPETLATKEIEKAAKALEEGSAFNFLLDHLNSDEEQKKKFNKQIDALEELKKACDETKNLSADALKEYIQTNKLSITGTQGDSNPIHFLAAAIRMSELKGVGVPTQSQLYIILHHLQRLKDRKKNPDEQTAVFYQLDAGEGKTLTLQMMGLLDAYFGIQNDIQTHQRDLAKTGAAGIQELASEFFGIQVRDLYRRTEQQALNQTANLDKNAAASFEDFQKETLEKAHIVYIDVYDNMLQMAKRTHLKDGPRKDVRDPKRTHLSIDEVDHLLDISAKVTAHIAELEKDPKKLPMLKDFYRVLNDSMAKILSDQTLLKALEECKNSDEKRALTKKILLEQAQNFPEVTTYINELSKTPVLFDGWMNSALTVHTVLKNKRDEFYTFETEKRDGKEVQVLYITLKDTSGKVMRDAQWSAGVHQLLSDYWRNEQQQGRDESKAPYFIPPLSNTVLHTGVELLGDEYCFITGVTATLGSKKDKKQLGSLLPGKKIEIIELPASTPNRRFDFAPLVTKRVFEDFYDAMTEALEQKEAVILRFETIQEVEAYQDYCRAQNPNCIPYAFDDKRRSDNPMSENLVIRKLADGGVGVITNAGGRGTDFKNIKRLYMANAASAGTRATIQTKRRAGRFGASAITQVMVTPEELGLLMSDRKFSDAQQKILFKPLKQRFFESTVRFQKRLNEQRLAQKQAYAELIKEEIRKKAETIGEKTNASETKPVDETHLFLDPKKKHILFANDRLKQKQEEKDSQVNSESAHKMLQNRIMDAIQSAVMPHVVAANKDAPIHAAWHACLEQIQTQISLNKVDEAIQSFEKFAVDQGIKTEDTLEKIKGLMAQSIIKPR